MSYQKMMKWQRTHRKGTRQPILMHTNSGFWPSSAWLENEYFPYMAQCERESVTPMECEAFYKSTLRGEVNSAGSWRHE